MSSGKFNWIKSFFQQRTSFRLESVEDIIPNIFNHYFEIHFNVGIIDNFPFSEFPANDFTIEAINKKIEINKKFNLFLNQNDESLFRLTSIKELSEMFDLPYHRNLLREFENYTGIKILFEESYKNIDKSVQNLSAKNEIHLFIKDLKYRWNSDDIEQENSNMIASKYIEYQRYFNFDFCTYLFSDDIEWCLITFEDFPVIFASNDLKFTEYLNGLELFKLNVYEII